jgi:hypothetical protein
VGGLSKLCDSWPVEVKDVEGAMTSLKEIHLIDNTKKNVKSLQYCYSSYSILNHNIVTVSSK